MGTARIFVFCILFLSIEGLILYSLEAAVNPLNQGINAINLLSAEPPPAPNFDSSPFAFISNTVQVASYAVALTVYTIRLVVSLFSFPFVVAGRVLIFNGRYPFLMIINGSIILFLAYATITRITGGD